MTRAVAVSAVLAAALALSGCAASTPSAGPSAAASEPRQCFWAERVNGFNVVDRDTLRVNVGVREVYELEVDGAGCFDVDWALAIGLRSRGGGTICSGYDAEVLYNAPGRGPQRCLVTGVRRVSEAELEAEKARR